MKLIHTLIDGNNLYEKEGIYYLEKNGKLIVIFDTNDCPLETILVSLGDYLNKITSQLTTTKAENNAGSEEPSGTKFDKNDRGQYFSE